MTRILSLTLAILVLTRFGAWSQCNYTISTTVTNVSCYNGTTGSVVVNVSGGTAPYQYQLAEAGAGAWQSSNTFSSLIANNYPVSVKDATGCVKTVYITISQPANLATTYTATNPTCTNANDGSITTNTTGGAAPYTYSWTKNGTAFSTNQNISNLSPANYLLIATDANGCTAIPVVASQVTPISLSGFNQDVIADGTGAPTSSTTQPLDDHSNVFYASGYKISTTAGTAGLPASGSFTSAQNSGRTYQLASYTGNNSLVMSSAANYGSATSGTLTFAAANQSTYSTLYVVGTTGNGTGTVNYTVNFSDATSYSGALTFPDWFLDPNTTTTQRALGGLDRVSWAATGATYNASTNFNLFESPINIPVASQGKNIASVAFTWAGSGSARVNLFAITGNTSSYTGIPISEGPVSTVTPAVSVTSNANSNTFCTGQSVTFTATPVNGGTAPTYQWYKNYNTLISGATSATYTSSTLNNNDKIYVVMTSSLTCTSTSTASSTKVVMTSGTVPASVSISPASANICSGSPLTFTAAPTNGGTAPTYQWYKNNALISGATARTYSSSSLANGDNIKAVMTSSISCATGNPATSNVVPVSVTTTGTPSVSITAVPAVTFTATPTYGGASPTYEWYKNNTLIPGANGSTYFTGSAAVNDVFWVKMTSNYACATAPAAQSNFITVSNIILPITLESFTLATDNVKVQLQWKTSYEFHNRQFLVQRSLSGSGFTTIGTVAATNVMSGSNYSYGDQPLVPGTYQYRIVQEDYDGRTKSFEIKTAVIRHVGFCKVLDLGSSWTLITGDVHSYEFMDTNGKILQKGTFESTTSIAKPPVRGLYLLRLADGSGLSVVKLMVY